MITGINQAETLTKHKSYKCTCKFDGRKCNSNQKWNKDKCWCACKNKKTLRVQKRLHFQITELQNPATCSCQNESIIDKSVTMCDETMEETKTVPTNFKKKSSLWNKKFLRFTCCLISLMIAVSINCYLIKCKLKQKH